MQNNVNSRVPEEACGLIGGLDSHALEVFPTTNVLHSPVRYRVDPREQLEIFQLIDERDWELLAIYHSHPEGPARPSATDIKEAFYPEAVHLIWFRSEGEWICMGFLIQEGNVTEVPIHIESKSN